jgi:hypothetical protein
VHRGVRNICRTRPFSFSYFSGDIDKVTRRYSRRLSLLSRSEIIIRSEIKNRSFPVRNRSHPESDAPLACPFPERFQRFACFQAHLCFQHLRYQLIAGRFVPAVCFQHWHFASKALQPLLPESIWPPIRPAHRGAQPLQTPRQRWRAEHFFMRYVTCFPTVSIQDKIWNCRRSAVCSRGSM